MSVIRRTKISIQYLDLLLPKDIFLKAILYYSTLEHRFMQCGTSKSEKTLITPWWLVKELY